MTRRSLFNFSRQGDLFVPADKESSTVAVKGRAQVGYSRRFFMGALAAGVCAATQAPRFQSLRDYVVGIDRSCSADETVVFARTGSTALWLELEPAIQAAFPVIGEMVFRNALQQMTARATSLQYWTSRT